MMRTIMVVPVLVTALLLCLVRPATAGPPKLEISNTTVIIASSVLGVALATTAIVNHFRGGKKVDDKQVEKKEEKKEKVYTPKSKADLENELKKMRRVPADLDRGDPDFDKSAPADDGYEDDAY